jgi:hypothetical protein
MRSRAEPPPDETLDEHIYRLAPESREKSAPEPFAAVDSQ